MGKMSELAYELEQLYDGTEGMSEKELTKLMNSCRYKKCKKISKLTYNKKSYCIQHYKKISNENINKEKI